MSACSQEGAIRHEGWGREGLGDMRLQNVVYSSTWNMTGNLARKAVCSEVRVSAGTRCRYAFMATTRQYQNTVSSFISGSTTLQHIHASIHNGQQGQQNAGSAGTMRS